LAVAVGRCAGNQLTHHDKETAMRAQKETFSPPFTPGVPLGHPLGHRLLDRGAATAEYAIATMAAVGFAGLLVVIMRSDEVRGILTDLVRSALTFTG